MKFQIQQAVEILSQTPETLRSLLGKLSDDWVKSGDDSKNWSPFDVVGHFIHAEETDWIPRTRVILGQGEDPTFPPFDRLGHLEKSKGKTLDELLENFAHLRQKSLETLREMDIAEEKLKLPGIHPELGTVDLEQLLSTWVVHDLTHIRQIVIILAKKYTENVGPWKEYLSILQS